MFSNIYNVSKHYCFCGSGLLVHNHENPNLNPNLSCIHPASTFVVTLNSIKCYKM